MQNARWAAGRGAVRMEKRVANKEKSDSDRVFNLAIKEKAQRIAREAEEKEEKDADSLKR